MELRWPNPGNSTSIYEKCQTTPGLALRRCLRPGWCKAAEIAKGQGKVQSNLTEIIPQYRDNPTLLMGKSFHRPRSLQTIIKFKGASLFHIKNTEILRWKFTNFQAAEFNW